MTPEEALNLLEQVIRNPKLSFPVDVGMELMKAIATLRAMLRPKDGATTPIIPLTQGPSTTDNPDKAPS